MRLRRSQTIAGVIGNTDDPYEASKLNTESAIDALSECEELRRLMSEGDLKIHGAIYHTHCGAVDFL